VLISSLPDNILAMVGVFSQHRERIKVRVGRVTPCARERKGTISPSTCRTKDGASHKACLPFVRERLMALVAVLAAGEAAVVVAA
jgi:hypothetical protein